MTNPKKYSKEWYAEHGPDQGHPNPIIAKTEGWPVRLSKSKFITYDSCPRKYWWGSVANVWGPPTHFMRHGTAVHRALENLYGNWRIGDSEEYWWEMATCDWEDQSVHDPVDDTWDKDQKETYEKSVQSLLDLELQRLNKWGEDHFAPVEFEIKHTAMHHKHNFMLVGAIDGVHRHPDGGLVITELKTGKASKFKLTKTRKELCYYRYLLARCGFDEAVYFYYLFPEATNFDLYLELEGKKNTEVWLGETQGMAVLEKVNMRSVNAMHKALDKTCNGIEESLYQMKWNDFFCTQWCDFHMGCESELIGMEDDVTLLYTGGEEW